MTEHDGVDQRHGDPAELACDEGQGEMNQRWELAADVDESQAHR